MPIEAMKSAGPNTRAISRGEAAAIASTAARPAAFSICASMPIRPGSSPADRSTWPSSTSSQTTAAGSLTLGRTSESTAPPAPSATAMTSRYAHGVVASLTRTATSLPSQPPARSAATASWRAAGFSSGATESSRSSMTWLTGRPRALARNRSLLAGTDMHDLRARYLLTVLAMSIRAEPSESGDATLRSESLNRAVRRWPAASRRFLLL